MLYYGEVIESKLERGACRLPRQINSAFIYGSYFIDSLKAVSKFSLKFNSVVMKKNEGIKKEKNILMSQVSDSSVQS